jgi:hypothetical protein
MGERLGSDLALRQSRYHRVMHLPAFSHGVTSFIWGIVFGVYIWIGGIAVGFSGSVTFVVGLLAAAGVFLFVRVYGEDEPRRP